MGDYEELTLDASRRRQVTLCNYNYSKEGIYHPDRVMDEYDLLYMQQGSWEIWEDDVCFDVGPDCALLLVPGRHHYSTKKCSKDMRNVFIHFTALDGDSAPATHAAPSDAPEILRLSHLTDCSASENVLRYIKRIIEHYWDNSIPGRQLKMQVLLDQLLIALADIHATKLHPRDAMISRIIRDFHTNPEKFYSPSELSDKYSVSLRTLSDRFKKATGTSVHRYQLNLKLAMAYDALPYNPQRSLHDIAHSYGFYDEFQFSKLFKRQYGISPSARRG